MVNSSKIPKQYNTFKKEMENLSVSYMKKKEKMDLTSAKNDGLEEESVTSNKKDSRKKNLKTAADDFHLRFSRARSSKCEDGGSCPAAKADEICMRECRRSRTLNSDTLQVPNNYDHHSQREHRPMNSPLVLKKIGKRLFEKRPSLPSSLPCSVANSPRFQRRHSDFLTDKQNGLSAEDFRRLSESLSHLEKAKPRPKPYEEKPFYLCPENGSFRRNYWKSESIALEKRIEQARSKEEEDKVTPQVQEERPLSETLPPLALSSIYTQESNKAKRIGAAEKEKRKHTAKCAMKNGSNERLSADISQLTKDLSDCRYLRIPKKS